MKKITLSLIIVSSLFFSRIDTSHAAFATVVNQLIDNIAQALSFGKETITAAASTVGSVNQQLDTINNKYLIPARDTMTLISMVKSSEMMQNLVLGQMGVDPLLIRNPERYVRNEGQKVVRSVVEDPELQSKLKDVSVLGTTIERAKYDALSLNSKLQKINTSSIPATEQQARCTDVALSLQARKDVSDASGNFTQEAYNARKRELNQALCTGDPNQGQTKTNLMASAEKSANWDSWLALTGGDNDWVKDQKSQYEVQQEVLRKAEEKKKEIEANGNIKSETKCLEYVSEGVCKQGKEVVMKTADAVNSNYKNALDNPTRAALAGFGKGAGSLLGSVVTAAGTAFTTINLLQNMSNSFGSLTDDGGSTYGNNPVANTALTVSAAPVRDLATNPQLKATIIKSPKEQLANHKDALSKLITTDTKYMSTLAAERSSLDGIKNCFETLTSEHPELGQDGRVLAASNFYETAISSNNTKYNEVANENSLAAKGVSMINDTLAKIDSSLASEEIMTLFLTYQDTFKEQNIPDMGANAERTGELGEYAQKVSLSLKEDGDIYNHNNTCIQMREQYRGYQGGSTNTGNTGGGI